MGIGKRRLQRLEGGAPDLRYGKREYRSRAGTWTIDSFLQICYDNIAETTRPVPFGCSSAYFYYSFPMTLVGNKLRKNLNLTIV